MSDESGKEVIWVLDKDIKNLTTDERLKQVEEEAEKSYGEREIVEKKDLERERMKHEHRDSRKDHWGEEKERTKVEGQETNARRNFAIPHFLKTKDKKNELKTVTRQNPATLNNQFVDSRGRIELREGQMQRLGKLFRAGTGSAISAEKRKTYLDIVLKYAGKANNKGKVNISDLKEIDRVLLGKRGTKRQTREFMEDVREGKVAGVKIEKDTDMRKLFSPSTARKMKNALEQIYNPGPTSAKPASARPEKNESPRFSSGNRGSGPSSSVRP